MEGEKKFINGYWLYGLAVYYEYAIILTCVGLCIASAWHFDLSINKWISNMTSGSGIPRESPQSLSAKVSQGPRRIQQQRKLENGQGYRDLSPAPFTIQHFTPTFPRGSATCPLRRERALRRRVAVPLDLDGEKAVKVEEQVQKGLGLCVGRTRSPPGK